MSSVAFPGPQNVPDPTEGITPFDLLADFKGTTLTSLRGEEERVKRERGRQNDLCSRAPETLASPLNICDKRSPQI